MRFVGLPGQPQGRPREERRPHGLLLHARRRAVRAGRRHGRPPRRRGRLAAGAADAGGACSSARPSPTLKDPLRFLHDAIIAGHHQLLRYATERALIDTPRTTIVACVLQGNAAYWAHCGDSRLYLVRGDKLIARTRDHSYSELQETHVAGGADRRALQPQRALHLPGQPGQAGGRHRRPAAHAARRPRAAVLATACGAASAMPPSASSWRASRSPTPCPSWSSRRCAAPAPKSDNVTVLCVEWEAAEDGDSAERRVHADLGDEVFASTIQASMLGDGAARRARRRRDRALDPRDQRSHPALVATEELSPSRALADRPAEPVGSRSMPRCDDRPAQGLE